MKIDGYEVRDVKAPLYVKVTKGDVRRGTSKTARSCAIAEAIIRQYGAKEAIVQTSRAYVRTGRTWKRFFVPEGTREQVIAFDREGTMETGEYRLSPVQPSVRLDAQPARKAKGYKGGAEYDATRKGPKRKYRKTEGVRQAMNGRFDWE